MEKLETILALALPRTALPVNAPKLSLFVYAIGIKMPTLSRQDGSAACNSAYRPEPDPRIQWVEGKNVITQLPSDLHNYFVACTQERAYIN